MTHLLDQPLPELLTALTSGSTTATDLVEESLRRVAAHRDLHALLTVDEVGARAAAARVDQARAEGRPVGKLAGVPIAVKDALLTRGWPTTAASKILVRSQTGVPSVDPQNGWRPPYDATAVARLRAADAVIIGKANMDEFAMGSSNENSAFAPARNPWATDRTPGGSSGGSAVSVAAGLAPLALGSDTGGSIRQPASLCGVVGVKPTYGRVSRYGLIAFASSLDQIGPFARDVRSAAALLEVISGVDENDSTSSSTPVPNYLEACGRDVRGLRIGVPAEYFGAGIDSEVEASVREAIEGLRGLGCTVHPVQLPHTRFGVATYYILATAEASSNLARFDGVRFGLRTERPGASLAELYGDTRDGGFGSEVKRRILLGTYVLSAGYYDAYYRKAQKVRTLISQDFDRAFQEVDLIATPCSPVPAFRLGERIADPLAMYLADIFTLPASLAGIPGLSVPCRPTPATAERPSLPVGLQLLAPHFHEERMFQAAAAWESIRPLASFARTATDLQTVGIPASPCRCSVEADGSDFSVGPSVRVPSARNAMTNAPHTDLTFRELEPGDGEALASFFDRCGSRCYCRYWHFDGRPIEWEERIGCSPQTNRDELLQAVACGSPSAYGLIAEDGDGCIRGWLKLAAPGSVPKLLDQRPYRRLEILQATAADAWYLACMLVEPDFRQQGHGRALFLAAIASLKKRQAHWLIGFPRREESLRDEALLAGPAGLYDLAGFERLHSVGPYEVRRLALAPA